MKTAAIIPARDEARTIASIVREVKYFVDEIIVVDDGSHDTTATIATKAGAKVVRHAINLGKGAALKTGCEFALTRKITHMIVIDADGQHRPKDIPLFIEKLSSFDVVLGYRTLSGSMPLVYRFGNQIIEFSSAMLFGLNVRDTQCGFRGFTSRAYRKLRWKSADYSVESEMIARIGRGKLRFTQIPIATIYADKYKGTTVIDGMKIMINMIRWKLLRSL